MYPAKSDASAAALEAVELRCSKPSRNPAAVSGDVNWCSSIKNSADDGHTSKNYLPAVAYIVAKAALWVYQDI
jgi:hypothetical protein